MFAATLLNTVTAQEGSGFIQQELGFIILLAIASAVAMVIYYTKFNLPYTVALVLVGLAIAFVPQGVIPVNISSDLILALLVPPLLFEATLHIQFDQLRLDIIPILLIAIVGSLLGAVVVAAIVVWALGLPWPAAIAFGALISATDPVAVISFFRSLGVSKRLALLVEGESLLNDAVALVLFLIAVEIGVGNEAFSFVNSVGQFLSVAFGGLVVGIMLGGGVSYLILKNVNDHLIETVTTLTLAFGSYVIAEELHVSGILAVVAAGMFVGNVGFYNTSPTTKIAMNNFWELLAFISNSLVFLIIGIEIDIFAAVQSSLGAVLIAVGAVLFSRLIVIYSLTALNNYFNPRRHIPRPFRHVMFWGGMRGAISLALALTLTGNVFGAPIDLQIRFMTFGVVLFTLLAQGLTIEKLITWLGLSVRDPHELEQQITQGSLYAKVEGRRELDRLHRLGLLDTNIWEEMSRDYEAAIQEKRQALQKLLQLYPNLKEEMMESAQVDALKVERSAISEAARLGLISEEAAETLIHQVDDQVLEIDPEH